MNGNNIIITQGGLAIAATRSHEIQVESELIEISSPTSGVWREYIAGRKDWSVNVNVLVLGTAATQSATSSNITDVLKVGNRYTLVIKDRSNTYSMTGDAILTVCRQTYTRGNLVQGTFQFKGTGALT